MNDTIDGLLNTLNQEQTETLLRQAKSLPLSRKKQRRINRRLLRGQNRPQNSKTVFIRRALAVAAAVAVIASAGFSVFGTNEISYRLAKTIDSFYAFVPNYGFIESEERPDFVLDEKVTTEKKDIVFSLCSAYINGNRLTVVLTLQRKNMSHEDFLQQKQSENAHQALPKLTLYVNETAQDSFDGWKTYEDFTGVSSSGVEEQMTYQFTLQNSTPQESTSYRLTYEKYNLTLSFSLIPFSKIPLSDLPGATDIHNQILVMATPAFSEDRLEVSLFPINNSDYSLYSFTKEVSLGSPNGQDLHLETESGVKTYETPGGYMGPNAKFAFSIMKDDQNFTLRIPFLMMRGNEYQNIRLRLPKKGETLTLNLPLTFRDCTVTIVEAQRREAETIGVGQGDELKLTFRYDNKSANKILANFGVTRLTRSGKNEGAAWSILPDENGVTQEMYIALEKGDWGSLYLQFNNPVYFLTDEYTLTFNR